MAGTYFPRIMITAPASGSGKTLLTCGILCALHKLHKCPAAFKCGPDYIDPMFHEKVLHTKSKNLDTYFTDEALTKALFAESAKGADISVVEGVMGYYDGIAGTSTEASSYDLSKTLEMPAVLVVDASGASVSVCALIKGFLDYRKHSGIRGVILNKVSDGFYPRIKALIEKELHIPVCGYIPKLKDMKIDSRHLGLMLPGEILRLNEMIDRLGEQCLRTLDIEKLIEIADSSPALTVKDPLGEEEKPSGRRPIIAVAWDRAFCFYYKDNLNLLSKLGADIRMFSPLRDTKLPDGTDGLWIGGGYPELHAKELEKNEDMRTCIRNALESGMPCIAECGGFLYLKESLTDDRNMTYPMVGYLKGGSHFTGKLSRFGYVRLKAKREQILSAEGAHIKGHEFHYMDTDDNGAEFLAEKPGSSRSYECAYADKTLYAGFPHLYLYSNIEMAKQFIRTMKEGNR